MGVIKISLLYFSAVLFIWSNVYCNTVEPAPLIIRYTDPLHKVLKSDSDFGNERASMDAARGEVASLQFVVRSGNDITGLTAVVKDLKLSAQVRFVGYVKVSAFSKEPAKDRIYAADDLYPDPLMEDATINVAANNSQPVWVSVSIPLNAAPGIYNGKLVIEGNGNIHEEKSFQIRVFAVQLKQPDLQVSLWPSMENPRLGGMDKKLSLLTAASDFKPFTDEYWTLLKKMAEMMHQYYQNVIMVYPVHTVEYTLDNKGKYTFDFTRLDKTISTFKAAGVNGRIEGSFLGGRDEGWFGPFAWYYYVNMPGQGMVSRTGNLKNKELINFYRQYIPALVAHLKEKKWYSNYYQHLGDEPLDQNIDSYKAFYAFIKELAPDMKIIEAVQTINAPEDIEVLIPQLDFLKNNYEYYKRRINSGKEVWLYTCWLPQGEYANRFIEQPLIKTRLLHWINYRYNVQGYLHWAYNNWSADPLHNGGEKGDDIPGGDKWIVYPKKDGLLSSIRLEAMRDGIVDNELLKMLAAKDPKQSAEIAASIIHGFDSYETNIMQFRKARTKLLEALSN
jgi:hypothetical protein